MKYLLTTAAASSLFMPTLLFAQKLQNPLKVNSFEVLFKDVLTDIIIPVSATLAVFFIVWAGLAFVTAQGNESKLTQAKTRLMYVLIGSAIIVGAEIILALLLNTVGAIVNG